MRMPAPLAGHSLQPTKSTDDAVSHVRVTALSTQERSAASLAVAFSQHTRMRGPFQTSDELANARCDSAAWSVASSGSASTSKSAEAHPPRTLARSQLAELWRKRDGDLRMTGWRGFMKALLGGGFRLLPSAKGMPTPE
jgi:hypothetical protein